jgi:hypothetical protein
MYSRWLCASVGFSYSDPEPWRFVVARGSDAQRSLVFSNRRIQSGREAANEGVGPTHLSCSKSSNKGIADWRVASLRNSSANSWLLLPVCRALLYVPSPTDSSTSPGVDQGIIWKCPKCQGPMCVVERLTIVQMLKEQAWQRDFVDTS